MAAIDAIGEQVDRALLRTQGARNGGPEVRIVFYQQDAHGARYLSHLNRN
jgi:hypothetical protein